MSFERNVKMCHHEKAIMEGTISSYIFYLTDNIHVGVKQHTRCWKSDLIWKNMIRCVINGMTCCICNLWQTTASRGSIMYTIIYHAHHNMLLVIYNYEQYRTTFRKESLSLETESVIHSWHTKYWLSRTLKHERIFFMGLFQAIL